jgi:hypothetical protein
MAANGLEKAVLTVVDCPLPELMATVAAEAAPTEVAGVLVMVVTPVSPDWVSLALNV